MLTATYPFNYIKHNMKILELMLILCYSLLYYKFNVITRMLIINIYSQKGLKCTQITFYCVYLSLLYRLLIAESLDQKHSNWRLSFEKILRTSFTTSITCLFHCSRLKKKTTTCYFSFYRFPKVTKQATQTYQKCYY